MGRLFLKKISDKIRLLAETAYQITKLAHLFRNTLEKVNFKITDKIESISTAFIAQWGSGHT
jgi:metal-dependent amidase/aminoacylase/carboxypeptidase family protein